MYDFKVGDTVQIKEWDEMVEEFGLDNDGDVPCDYEFTTEMKHLCGMEVEIEDIFEGLYGFRIQNIESWKIGLDMIKPVSKNSVLSKESEIKFMTVIMPL